MSSSEIYERLQSYLAKENKKQRLEVDLLGKVGNAVGHFCGNHLEILIRARTGDVLVNDLFRVTEERREGFIQGISHTKIDYEALRKRSADLYYGLEGLYDEALKGNWHDLRFLRKYKESCLSYLVSLVMFETEERINMRAKAKNH